MLDDKNIIMTISTGRSGTGLLAKLLDLAGDMSSVHEPVPAFQDVFVNGQSESKAALAFMRDVKGPVIAACGTAHYAETSHYFGQGFLDASLDLKIPLKLVILNRDPRSVAKSFERIKCIPMRTDKGRTLMPHPDKASALSLPNWEAFSDYQLCYWYCLETEERKERARELAAKNGIPVVEIDLEDLKSFEAFASMASALGLTLQAGAEEAHSEITATKVNRKGKYLPKIRVASLDGPEAEVWAAVDAVAPGLRSAVSMRYDRS